MDGKNNANALLVGLEAAANAKEGSDWLWQAHLGILYSLCLPYGISKYDQSLDAASALAIHCPLPQ